MLRKYTDNEIIAQAEMLKGFDGWQKGVYDFWVRANKTAKEVDVFTDKVYTYSVDDSGEPSFRMVCTGTSLTGSWALRNYKSYNDFGAAVLAAGYFVRDSHAAGLHKGRAAYRQVRPFPFYRDGDKDLLAESIGRLYTNEIIFANCHGAKVNAVSTIIYNWSAACPVRNSYTQFKGWLAYMDKRPLSLGIINEF